MTRPLDRRIDRRAEVSGADERPQGQRQETAADLTTHIAQPASLRCTHRTTTGPAGPSPPRSDRGSFSTSTPVCPPYAMYRSGQVVCSYSFSQLLAVGSDHVWQTDTNACPVRGLPPHKTPCSRTTARIVRVGTNWTKIGARSSGDHELHYGKCVGFDRSVPSAEEVFGTSIAGTLVATPTAGITVTTGTTDRDRESSPELSSSTNCGNRYRSCGRSSGSRGSSRRTTMPGPIRDRYARHRGADRRGAVA